MNAIGWLVVIGMLWVGLTICIPFIGVMIMTFRKVKYKLPDPEKDATNRREYILNKMYYVFIAWFSFGTGANHTNLNREDMNKYLNSNWNTYSTSDKQ